MLFPNETNPRIWGYGPCASTALDDNSDWVCLKGAVGCWIYITEIGATGAALVLTVHESTAADTGTTAITTAWPIYYNLLTTTADTWTRATDAITYSITPAATASQVNFYIDASILSDGYDWIQLGSTTGDASNTVYVEYQLVGTRYKQETPPTAIA